MARSDGGRCVVWVQWKTRGQRYRELRRLKVPERGVGGVAPRDVPLYPIDRSEHHDTPLSSLIMARCAINGRIHRSYGAGT